MVVLEALECAAQHDVLKVVRAGVLGDERLVREHKAEVATLPGDRFIRADEAVGDAGDGSLAGLCGALFVEVDVEGEQEAAVGWGGDAGLDLDGLHGLRRAWACKFVYTFLRKSKHKKVCVSPSKHKLRSCTDVSAIE